MQIEWPPLQLAPHPDAPLFSGSDGSLMLEHALQEITSQGGFRTTEEIRQLLRQAGLVNLWFYLKYIAGYDGPYDLLNTELHVDMCNFRQKVAETPGIKAGMFLPRSSLKSTIGDHGANGWELIRNPNLRIGCVSEIADRAEGFVATTIDTFTKNELHKWLYPEHAKANRDNTTLILTSRTKRYVEPNLMAITAGGSTQGVHLDVLVADDIVGEKMLNAEHVSGADMAKMSNWLHSNMKSLVVSWLRSRVLVIGTRYAEDDPYEVIMRHSKEHWGYWDDEDIYPVDPTGEWTTYYRPAKQELPDGTVVSICPEQYSVEGLDRIADENPWLYWSQYMNKAYAARKGDFSQYHVEDVDVRWSDERKTYIVYFPDGEIRPITEADVVSAGDPAASTKQAGVRTSRSATVVIARWWDNRIVVLEGDCGFVEPTKFFDWLFWYREKYGILLRATYVEAQAGFKAFIPIGRKEQELRGKYINIQPIPALGDKEATIRNVIQPFLARQKLFVRKEIAPKLRDEIRMFPGRKMDLLDALKIAIFKSVRPDPPPDEEYDEDEEDIMMNPSAYRRMKVSPITGY